MGKCDFLKVSPSSNHALYCKVLRYIKLFHHSIKCFHHSKECFYHSKECFHHITECFHHSKKCFHRNIKRRRWCWKWWRRMCCWNGEKDGVVVRGKNKNYGRVCGQWWKRGNSWCGGSKVMHKTSLKTIYTRKKRLPSICTSQIAPTRWNCIFSK